LEPDVEAYSGFEGKTDQGTTLAQQLEALRVEKLFVCGLATDYCVKVTALDGVKLGFEVLLVDDACRGVDVPPGSAVKAIEEMKAAGVRIVVSGDLE